MCGGPLLRYFNFHLRLTELSSIILTILTMIEFSFIILTTPIYISLSLFYATKPLNLCGDPIWELRGLFFVVPILILLSPFLQIFVPWVAVDDSMAAWPKEKEMQDGQKILRGGSMVRNHPTEWPFQLKTLFYGLADRQGRVRHHSV